MRLFAVALGAGIDDDGLRDIARADPLDVAGIANAHHLHTLLFAAVQRDRRVLSCCPADFWIYLEEMQKANAARNWNGRRQLQLIAEHFMQAEIDVVVLKGGAGLLDPLSTPSWRFVSDLDLLISADRAEEAQSILAKLGGRWDTFGKVTAPRMHHLPPIQSPDWDFPVELHLQVGQSTVSKVLSSTDVRKSAIASSVRGLSIPTLRQRYLHHVLHTAHGRGDGDAIYLRAIMEHHGFLARLAPAERVAANATLASFGLAHHARRLDLLTGMVSQTPLGRIAPHDQIWLFFALHLFGSPKMKTSRLILRDFARHLRRVSSSRGDRKYYLDILRSKADRQRLAADFKARIAKIR